jgi:hypothetical protein
VVIDSHRSGRLGADDPSDRSEVRPNRGVALRVLPFVCVTTAAATIAATARYGIGLTPDSLVYVTGAQNLAHGHGYTTNGLAISDFPPAYSAVLSLAERSGHSVFAASRALSVVAFVVVVLLGYVLLRRHVRSGTIVACATVIIGCSAALLEVYEKALSEHLFLIVILLFALVAEELMTRPRHLALLGAMVILTWAAFYLRYIGIVLIPVAALVVVAAEWRRGRGSAVARALVLAIVGASAPALWVIRNRHAGVPALGHRSASSASLITHASRVANEVSTWLATDRAPTALRALVFLAFVAACGLLGASLAGKKVPLPADRRSMFVLILLVVAYVGYLIVSASLVAFAEIDTSTRFMAPVFVPTLVIAAWLFEYAREHVDASVVRHAMTTVGVAFVVMNVGWFAVVAAQSADRGAGGYATKHYHDSQILRAAKDLDYSKPIFSNDAQAIALFLGKTVQQSVARTYFQSDEQTGRLASFVHRVQCAGEVQLVWLLPNGRSYLYTPKQLSTELDLRPRVTFSDGVIYDVLPLAPATSGCGK